MKSIKYDSVLIYAHHAPPQPSASSTRLLSLARYLKELGISVEFITSKKGPDIHEGFKIHRCKGRNGLVEILIKHSRSPILVSSPPGTPAAEVAAIARLLGYWVVVDIRDPFVSEALNNGDISPGLSTSIKLLLERSLFYSAHILSYVSNPLRIKMESHFGKPNPNYIIAPNGVDRNIFKYDIEIRQESREILGFGTIPVFIYVGILGGKSLDHVFNALAPVLKKGTKLLMVAVLDEFSIPIYESLKIQADDIGISDQIVWKFNATPDKVAFYLNASDIGINPLPFNRSYCLPVKTFEFLSCGVHPLNIVGKDNALLEIFEDSRLGTFSFSWEECTNNALELIERIDEIRSLAYERSESAIKFDRKDSNKILASALLKS